MTLPEGCAYVAVRAAWATGSAIFSALRRPTALGILTACLAIRALWAPRCACENLGP